LLAANDLEGEGNMQKITPHLWFDREAKEAAEFYASLFPNSEVTNVTTHHNTPSGDADIVSYELSGQPFMAISAGPLFKFNPSVSFFVNFDPSNDNNAQEHIDRLWEKLSFGGMALIPLQQYPFSERYGWVQDKYGLSWQLILSDAKGEERPFIVPSLMFVGKVSGKAEEATISTCRYLRIQNKESWLATAKVKSQTRKEP
jgi:predicted 3-demethylubiquinone-9 3-methyltransferase (glyoxalase superfamily)